MTAGKFNIGLALSRNFDKVTLEMIDEPIDWDSEPELKAQIRKRFKILQDEIELQFSQIQKEKR